MDSDDDLQTIENKKKFFRWKHRFVHSKALATGLAWMTLFLTYTLHSSLVTILPLVLEDIRKMNADALSTEAYHSTTESTNNINASNQQVNCTYNNNNNNTSSNDNTTTTTAVPCTTAAYGDLIVQNTSFVTTDSSFFDIGNFSYEGHEIGTLIAARTVVQLIISPPIGMLVDRIGYDLPMLLGYVLSGASCIVVGFANSYGVLMVGRCVQGVGTALSAVASKALMADIITSDADRGRHMGIMSSSVGLSLMVGPTIGGVAYFYSGQALPFLIICGLYVLTAIGHLATRGITLKRTGKTVIDSRLKKHVGFLKLLCDPYIFVALMCVFMGNLFIGAIEVGLPSRVFHMFSITPVVMGLSLLPVTVAIVISNLLFGWLGTLIGRWIIAVNSFILNAVSCVVLSLVTNFYAIIFVPIGLGVASGMLGGILLPMCAHLMDIRHTPVYGSIYAMFDVALALSFCIGPLLAGVLMSDIGFEWMMRVFAGLSLLFAPIVIVLRNPPVKNPPTEHTKLTEGSNYPPRELRTDDWSNSDSSSDIA